MNTRWSDEKLEEFYSEFISHRDEVHKWIHEEFPRHAEVEESRHKALMAAFPLRDDGETDLEGHRKAHEAMIKAARAQENFWNEMRIDIAKSGIRGFVALVVIVIGLAIVGIKAKFGIGGPSP